MGTEKYKSPNDKPDIDELISLAKYLSERALDAGKPEASALMSLAVQGLRRKQ